MITAGYKQADGILFFIKVKYYPLILQWYIFKSVSPLLNCYNIEVLSVV